MRRGKPLRRTAMKRSHRGTGPPQDVVEAVYERGAWSCEICSASVGPRRGVDHHIHHRRPRAMGGTDRPDTNLPSNLLLLCPPCHERIESERWLALGAGWLVPQTADPAEIAVTLAGERVRYLSPDGTYALHPPRWKEGDPS